jgi:hypothetical protein
MRRLTQLAVWSVLGVSIVQAQEFEYCWDHCHSAAMVIYEEHGYDPAAAFFDGCKESCDKFMYPT